MYDRGELDQAGKYRIIKYDLMDDHQLPDGSPISSEDTVRLKTVDETCYASEYREYDILTYPWQVAYSSLYFDRDDTSNRDHQRWIIIKQGGEPEIFYDGDVVIFQSEYTPEPGVGIRLKNDFDDYLRNSDPWMDWQLIQR